jgi:hypothetical protein
MVCRVRRAAVICGLDKVLPCANCVGREKQKRSVGRSFVLSVLRAGLARALAKELSLLSESVLWWSRSSSSPSSCWLGISLRLGAPRQ